MCKSQAQGGQRCPGHAREALTAAQSGRRATERAYAEGQATDEQLQEARAAVGSAWIAFASTKVGANELRERHTALRSSGDPNAEILAALIDDGARLAQHNRTVENAWRAANGRPPLTTALPATFDQERERASTQEVADAEASQYRADPLGLRRQRANPTPAPRRERFITAECGCRTFDAGGQKCYEHARAFIDRVETAAMKTNDHRIVTDWRRVALGEYASTPEGAADLHSRITHSRKQGLRHWVSTFPSRYRYTQALRSGILIAAHAARHEDSMRADQGLPAAQRTQPTKRPPFTSARRMETAHHDYLEAARRWSHNEHLSEGILIRENPYMKRIPNPFIRGTISGAVRRRRERWARRMASHRGLSA